MMYTAVAIAILVTLGITLARALMGPTAFDRIAAANMFGTKTVLLIAVFAFMSGRMDLLDIALVYALINFISIVAVLRLFSHKDFHSPAENNVISVKVRRR